MDREKYTIVDGELKIVEWYFDDRGKMPAQKYWENLEKSEKEKAARLFRYMAQEGKIKNKEKFVHEGDGIYAFKPSKDRFFCFFFGDGKVVVTNAYKKKSNKMPPGEKNKALGFRADYLKRVRLGEYYE
jgi:phage-related protein